MDSKIVRECKIGKNTKLWNFINLYECEIGDNCMIGSFVEIQKDARIGNNCRIQSHSFICSMVTIEDGVFVGHGVVFINDAYPPRGETEWKRTLIRNGITGFVGKNLILFFPKS